VFSASQPPGVLIGITAADPLVKIRDLRKDPAPVAVGAKNAKLPGRLAGNLPAWSSVSRNNFSHI
jgi:hypothetical protein